MFHFHDKAQGFQTYIHAQRPSESMVATYCVCMFGFMYVCLRHTYIHAWGLQTYIHIRSWALNIHTYTRSRASNIHAYTLVRSHNLGRIMLESQKPSQAEAFWTYLCFIIPWRTIRKNHTRERGFAVVPNEPVEGLKIKFRPGSPECFKTLSETKVWTDFLVQAGYLGFWCPEASNTEVYVCMHVCMFEAYIHTYIHTHYSPVVLIQTTTNAC